MDGNLALRTDMYKFSHAPLYPPGTSTVYSYFEARDNSQFDKTVFFGLQYIIKEYLEGKVFTYDKIDEAEELLNQAFGAMVFKRELFDYIVEKHNGYLPIKIKAVPEGSYIEKSNVLMTVENTDPQCFWLTNFLETLLSQVWYPCTVATVSRRMKEIINRYLLMTGNNDGLQFKLHDFGFRGVSSVESAGIGGCAHLVNFLGTDTVEAIQVARKYYNESCAGFSIPASEHSTITSWGPDSEDIAMKNMLDKYPDGIIACVSDSFDIYRACNDYWGGSLKDMVIARNGTLVVRPDSGEPTEVVPKILSILWDKFGGSITNQGYKLLDQHVRVIQGDGINLTSLENILKSVAANGFCTDNLAFGCGNGILQRVNRDDCSFAFKCSAINRNGEWQDVYKEPVTDKGKNSKRGRLKLINFAESYHTVDENDGDKPNELITVFENGKLTKEYTLAEIRERINSYVV